MRRETFLAIALTFLLNIQDCTSFCAGYDCLKEYVDKPDPNYKWIDTGDRIKGVDPLHLVGWTGYVLNFTSQEWLTAGEVSQPLWWHIMIVIVPNNLEYKNEAFLWIGANNNNDDGGTGMPDPLDYNVQIAGAFAAATKSVAAALFQIPNQPLKFSDDPLDKRRSEDAIIGYTWWKWTHYSNPNPEWLVHLPMTKAAVRAMDTITDFMTSPLSPPEIQNLNCNPQQYITAGASKRGWITWLTGTVDPRVMGMVPVVFDLLNAGKNLHHHFQAYGGWSFTFKDYWQMNITNKLDSGAFSELMNIIDPYEYREKLLLPKIVCSGAMDEFFQLDDSNLWWHQMPYADEFNRLLIVPNAEHSQITGFLELLPAVSTWARSLLLANSKVDKALYPFRTIEERNARSLQLMKQSTIPKVTWTINEDNGEIVVQTDSQPKAVHLWHATTCGLSARRDFRIANKDDPCLCGIGDLSIAGYDHLCGNLAVLWSAEELEETSPGSLRWVAKRNAPFARWTAFFVDFQFEGPKFNRSSKAESTKNPKAWPVGEDGVYVFTTEASIVPRNFPFPDCHGDDCFGNLV